MIFAEKQGYRMCNKHIYCLVTLVAGTCELLHKQIAAQIQCAISMGCLRNWVANESNDVFQMNAKWTPNWLVCHTISPSSDLNRRALNCCGSL